MQLFFFMTILTVAECSLVEELRLLNFPKGAAAGGPTQQQLTPPPLNPTVGSPIPIPPATTNEMDVPDLECKHSPVWVTVQQMLALMFQDGAAFGMMEKADLETGLHRIMETAVKEVKTDECGLGKLMIQLLAIISADTDGNVILQSFMSETITSPILTLTLDIPWLAANNWPFIGLFSQMAARRVANAANDPETDGLKTPELIRFATGFSQAIIDEDWKTMNTMSNLFLEHGETLAPLAPLGYITALFTQAAIVSKHPEVVEKKHNAVELIMLAQDTIRHLVKQPEDFLVMLSTRWPLWGMAHLALNGIKAQ